MKIQDLLKRYALLPQVGAVAETLRKKSVKTVFLEGLMCSSAPMVFGSMVSKSKTSTTLFILQDADDAGYFYHDLTQLLGEERVLFFPSSYRRAIKYGQRDSANEILRTEVLSKLSTLNSQLFIVSYPEALSELVVSQKQLGDQTLVLRQGETIQVDDVTAFLR
jgi:transcription-repair coupling factor (superfamily II helicase)